MKNLEKDVVRAGFDEKNCIMGLVGASVAGIASELPCAWDDPVGHFMPFSNRQRKVKYQTKI